MGHALGFGTLWEANGLLDTAGQYTGDSGLAAFQEEFDLKMTASFVPTDGTSQVTTRATGTKTRCWATTC